MTALQAEIESREEAGWRIQQRGKSWVIMKTGTKLPHLMHIFLTVITFGLWSIVYAAALFTGGEKRVRLTEANGKVRSNKVW